MEMKQKEFLHLFLLLLLVHSCCATEERSKRQLYREQIPHNRPLSGNTYHMHHGFPHPTRFNENFQQIVPPNPNFSTTPPPEIPDGEAHDPPVTQSHPDDTANTHNTVLNTNTNNNNNNNLIVAVNAINDGNGASILTSPHTQLHLNKYQHLNTIVGYWHLGHEDFQLLTSPYPYSWSFRE